MVKECALANDTHWFKFKRSVGFEQHALIELTGLTLTPL